MYIWPRCKPGLAFWGILLRRAGGDTSLLRVDGRQVLATLSRLFPTPPAISMSQQHRKVTKRARRNRYHARKKDAAKATKAAAPK